MTAFVGLVLLVAVIGAAVSAADLRDRRRPDVPVNPRRLARLHDVGHAVPRRTPLRATDNTKENHP